MINGNSYCNISLHDAKAEDLCVCAEVKDRDGTRWASIKFENYDLSIFTSSRDEAVAIMRKFRAAVKCRA